jgi:hypothetical protein
MSKLLITIYNKENPIKLVEKYKNIQNEYKDLLDRLQKNEIDVRNNRAKVLRMARLSCSTFGFIN